MKKLLFFLISALTTLVACDDATDGLGSSIIDFEDNVEHTEATFNVVSRSVTADSITARSAYSYIGRIYDPETGVTMSANYMTQLAVNDYTQFFPPKDTLSIQDPSCRVDSCFLRVEFNSFYGDSLAKMGVVLHELDRPYSEDRHYPIYFDPIKAGLIREGGYTSTCSFSISNKIIEGHNEATASHSLYLSLNDPYTAKDGTKYNNYGSYLIDMYYKHPNYFKSAVLFNENVCPGFYIETVSGQGALGKIFASVITSSVRYKYSSTKDSSTICVIPGTKEVIQHSKFSDGGDADTKLISESNKPESDYTYVKSPVGIYTELTLDVDSILNDMHEDDSLSTVRIFIPRLNNTSKSEYVLDPPATLLMVRADSIHTFFGKEQIADSKVSYLATYSSTTNGYIFDNIATLITAMYNDRKTSIMSEEEYIRQHPNWNKVYLVPVETAYSTYSSSSAQILTSVTHSMELQSTKLKKGTAQDSPIKASVIYSRFKNAEYDE